MARTIWECTGEKPNHYEGKNGPVKERIFALVDKSPDKAYRLGHMVEFVMPDTEENAGKFPVGSLIDRKVEIGERKRREWQDAQRIEGDILSVDGSPVQNGKAETVPAASAKK